MNIQENNGKPTPSQILSILNSKKQVDLRQYWHILWRKKMWIILPCFVITLLSIIYALIFIRPIYEASASIEISSNRLLSSSLQALTPGGLSSRGHRDLTRKIKSSAYLIRLINQIDLDKDDKIIKTAMSLHRKTPYLSYEEILERVKVSYLRNSIDLIVHPSGQFFQLSAKNKSPHMSYLIVKTLTDIFIDEARNDELRGIVGVREFSDKQLYIYKRNVEESEAKLKNYQEKLASERASSVGYSAENIRNLRELKSSIEIAITNRNNRQQELKNSLPFQSEQSIWNKHPKLRSIINKIDNKVMEVKRNSRKLLLQGGNEESINNEMNLLRYESNSILMELVPAAYPQLNDQDRLSVIEYELGYIDLYILKARLGTINSMLNQFVKLAASEPSEQLAIERLENDLEENQRIYRMMLEQFRGSQLREALQESDVDIKYNVIEAAQIPISPVSGSKRNFVMIAFLFGLAFGGSIVLGLELVNQTIQTVTDVEDFLQMPVWGVIPKTRELALFKVHFNEKNSSREDKKLKIKNIDSEATKALESIKQKEAQQEQEKRKDIFDYF